MKKLIVTIAALLASVFVFVGCRSFNALIGNSQPFTEEPNGLPTEWITSDNSKTTEVPTTDGAAAADDAAIDAARLFAAHINELYGIEYKEESIEANGFLCSFVSASGPEWKLIEVAVGYNDGSNPNAPNGYYIEEAYPNIDPKDPEYAQWSASLDMERWWNEFSRAEHVLTEKEIADSGCAATEGTEYSQAAAECYAKLLADLFKNAPEGSPMRCREADVYSCRLLDVPEWASPDRYIEFEVWIAVVPEDIHGFWEYTDLTSRFYCSESEPYYGRMRIGGRVALRRNSDGDWYGDAVLGFE